MHGFDLIATFAGGLAAALVFGYVTHRLGLSPIVGYLIAGIAVGPHSPGFVADLEVANQFAEIGVILLMFGVGLQFHLRELLAVRRIAVPGALVQILVATALATALARVFGWTWAAGVVFGIAIAVASTVVLIRVLTDSRDLHTPAGHVAVGWLVLEDLFTVVVLVLLPALFGSGVLDWAGVPRILAVTGIKLVVLAGAMSLVGARVVPWLLERVAATRSRELFTLTILVVALGIAVGTAKLFGFSMALGAFLAGMAVGRSEFSVRAATEALPMRDAFSVLFFVSVGMLFDPRTFVEEPTMVAATLAIILVGKPLAAFGIISALGHARTIGAPVAAALAQIGEFSFMLASLATQIGVLPAVAMNVLIAAAIVSITLNPLAYRLARRVGAPAARRDPASDGREIAPGADLRHRAIVVGHGPVGATVVRLLQENGIEPTVVELNLETVRHLREAGIAAVYGDANHAETLRSAGVERAGSLVLSASDAHAGEAIIRAARGLNPRLRILARADYLRQIEPLRQAGARTVIASEVEVALALTVAILDDLGATPDQIDRERARVHRDLVARPNLEGPVVNARGSA